MNDRIAESLNVSLFFSRSSSLTSSNKTGSWSFSRPRRSERAAPCAAACPCAEDIPRIEMLASRGRSAEALAAILEENPLPGVCGRVCFHPCEAACNRLEFDEAVSVNALERAISDVAAREGAAGAALASAPALSAATARPSAGRRRVAIIGSGPAGLSAAYFLARLGHDCEIREAASAAGGLLRWGIPEYRLPTAILEREISRIESLGVRLIVDRNTDESALAALAEDFDAIVVAAGKGRASTLGVPGEALAEDALALLSLARRLEAPRFSRENARVAVVGGGNTAVDAARTLLRLGAEPIIVYRRRREDMPALAAEVEAALSEGVRFMELASPISIEGAAGRLTLKCARMRAGDAGSDGRASVSAIAGSSFDLEVSAVYAAVGAAPAEAWMKPGGGSTIRLSRCAIDQTAPIGRPIAYAGDLAGARESVSDAIASGKEAAIALDALFRGGSGRIGPELDRALSAEGGAASFEVYAGGPRASRSRSVVKSSDINDDYVAPSRRRRHESLDPGKAARSFDEVERGLGSEEAVSQAARCLNCGICNDCDNCRTFCPEAAVDIGARAEGDPPWRSARTPNLDYCKGCGICAVECPRGALSMEEARS